MRRVVGALLTALPGMTHIIGLPVLMIYLRRRRVAVREARA
ncbi:hypothetical protein ABT120_50020 [Nonomuraea angiospora]